MASSLFQKNQTAQANNNPIQMMQNFRQFMQGGMTPQNAKQIIEQKLQSGQITQQQLDSAMQQAQNLLQMFR